MSPAPAASTRVIVADELRDSADTLATLLCGNGVDARAVYDGRDALTVAGMWDPDGAVLDVTLPGISGYEVAREFRRRYGHRIRLVAYTGWSGATDRARAIECGFDGFLVKPAPPHQLLHALGHETALLVQRANLARLEQIQRQLALGHSLLDRANLLGGSAYQVCDVLDRALEICRTGLEELPVDEVGRAAIASDIDRLAKRIARIRSVH